MLRHSRYLLFICIVLLFMYASMPALGATPDITGPETPALVISGNDISRGQGFLHNYVVISPSDWDGIAASASGEATYRLGLGDCFSEALVYSTYEDHGTPAWIYRRVYGLDLRELAAALGVDTGKVMSISVYASDGMSKTLTDAFGVQTKRWYYGFDGQRMNEIGPILALYETTSETRELSAGTLPPMPALGADSLDRVDNVFGYGQTAVTEINSCYWVKNVRRLRFGTEDPALSVYDQTGKTADVSLSTLISRGQWQLSLGTVKARGVPLDRMLQDMGMSVPSGYKLAAQSIDGAFQELTAAELSSAFVAWQATDNGSAVTNRSALRLYNTDGRVLADLGSLRLMGENDAPPAPVGPSFSDLGNYEWAAEAVNSLAAQGIVKGMPDGSFGAAQPIKRGDFILMLARAFAFPASAGDCFGDVPADSYYHDAIAAAKALGIAKGYGTGYFYPESSITRQEALTLLQRAMSVDGNDMDGTPADISSFVDHEQVADWAREAMGSLVGAGVIRGSNNHLYPLGVLTRAEMAVALHKALEL